MSRETSHGLSSFIVRHHGMRLVKSYHPLVWGILLIERNQYNFFQFRPKLCLETDLSIF